MERVGKGVSHNITVRQPWASLVFMRTCNPMHHLVAGAHFANLQLPFHAVISPSAVIVSFVHHRDQFLVPELTFAMSRVRR